MTHNKNNNLEINVINNKSFILLIKMKNQEGFNIPKIIDGINA